MWRAWDGPGHRSLYGVRTVSWAAPGIRVVENRNVFCAIDSVWPRWTTGSTRSSSRRSL